MKESAMIAYSYVRGSADKYGIDKALFQNNDFHIHVPDGATPKDGPSAGVTLVTALVSLLTGKKVRNDFAMTGEITLHGKVTAIGGVKEKTIGALRAGIKEIILPEENRKDLEEIPDDVKNLLQFHFVEHADEVLALMLEGFSGGKKSGKKAPAKKAAPVKKSSAKKGKKEVKE